MGCMKVMEKYKFQLNIFKIMPARLKKTNTSQVVPTQSPTRDKTYPDFFTSKSYPVFTEVYHLIPAHHQVVPE